MSRSLTRVVAALGLIFLTPLAALAQPAAPGRGRLHGSFAVVPWARGTHLDAMRQSASSATIPMSSYSIVAGKDGKTYSGTIVGGSPWASTLTSTTINAVVVPLKISIGKATFDPTAIDSCSGTSAQASFNGSPLVVNNDPVAFNLATGGPAITAQYIDAFRQAEFWSLVSGKGYSNPISYTFAAPYVVSSTVVGRSGTTYSSGCSLLGIVSYSWLNSYLTRTVMPSLTKSNAISPTSFVIFLMKNVVESTSSRPSVINCCILGYHGASGSPVQTYAAVEWDSTGLFGSNALDVAIASHEIAEWIDDPLGTNPTPAWGGVGQVSSCQTNLETGDPLTGTDMPPRLDGYHLQELAFFSWFYNSQFGASLGAGGKFSGNGTFGGPSRACPPGGTY